jgi:hypothetical protein
MATWPAELHAVVQLLRVALGTAEAKDYRWPAGVNLAVFAEILARHRVGAYLHHRLVAGTRAQLPKTVQELLAVAARNTARRALGRSAELVRIAQRFGDASIPFLTVKGPLLAKELYGGVGIRHAGDLDLLIAPERLADADKALRGAGCRRSQPDFELSPRQQREYMQLKHEFEYFNDATGVRIEVQWRLEGLVALTFDGLRKREVHGELGGQMVGMLPPMEHLTYLFVHGAKHGWCSLFWLLDVALALRETRNWEEFRDTAVRLGASRALEQGVRLCAQVLGVDAPQMLHCLNSSPSDERLVTEALRQVALPPEKRVGGAELLRQTRYQLLLQSDWSARCAILRPRLMSPACWKQVRLPDALFWLYYPAAPLLWALRQRGGGPR